MNYQNNIEDNNPLVEIIMPNYNKGQFLEEAINSVIDQKYKNWRLVIIDGASLDESKNILTKFEKKFNNINVIYLDRREKAAYARNLGIKLSKAEYIAFLDSDDYWTKDKLSEQISFMKKFNYDFTYTDYVPFYLSKDRKVFKKKVIPPDSFTYNQFIYNTSIATSSMLIKKSIIGSITCPDVKILEDYPFKCEILKTKCSAIKLKQNLLFYRITENSLQSNKLRNVYWLWHINRKYNKLSLFKNIMSVLMISISSIKRYGLK